MTRAHSSFGESERTMCAKILRRCSFSILMILIVGTGSLVLPPLAPRHAFAQVAVGPTVYGPEFQRRFDELKEAETPVILSMLEQIRQGMQRATDCVGDPIPRENSFFRRAYACSGRHHEGKWRDLGPLLWVLLERKVGSAVPLLEDLFRTPAIAWSDDLTGISSRTEIANVWVEVGRPDLRGTEGISFASGAIAADNRPSIELSAARLVLFREKRERGWSPELRALLDDPNWRVRRHALRLIGLRGPHEAWEQPRLIDALLDPEELVRRTAAARLSNTYGDDSWVDVGVASLDRDDLTDFARESIHRALSRRGLEARRTPQGWKVHRQSERDEE